MPSVSQKQHNLMEMVAHGGKPSSGKGPTKAVAKEYVDADRMKAQAHALRKRKPPAKVPDMDSDGE